MAEMTSEPTATTQGQNAGASSPTSETIVNVENPTTDAKTNVTTEGAPANDTAGTEATIANGLGTADAAKANDNVAGLAGEVSQDVAKQLHELETRLDATLGASEGRVTKAVANSADGLELERLSTEQVVSYLPTDAPQYVASYMTPVLWGIAAGIVAFLIGYVWDAARRLLGLAGKK